MSRRQGIGGGSRASINAGPLIGATAASSANPNGVISAEESSAQGAEVPDLHGIYRGAMPNAAQYTNPYSAQPNFWDRLANTPYNQGFNQYNLSSAEGANQLANAQALALYKAQTINPIENQQQVDLQGKLIPMQSDANVLQHNNILSEYRDTAAPQLYKTFSGGQDLMQQTDANQLSRARGAAGDQYSIGYNLGANELQSAQNQGIAGGFAGQDLVDDRAMKQLIGDQQLKNQLGTAQATGSDLDFAKTLQGQQHNLMSAELAARIGQLTNPYAGSYEFKAPSVVTPSGQVIVNPAYQARSDMGIQAKTAEEQAKAAALQAIINGLSPTAQGAPQPTKPKYVGTAKDGKRITY